MKTVLGSEPDDRGDDPRHWNVVQNNGSLRFFIIDLYLYSILYACFFLFLFLRFWVFQGCGARLIHISGARASQTVPHAHFHIIPRPPLDGRTPTSGGWVMFGRGQRDELDDDEAEGLVELLRSELAREVRRVKDEEGVDLEADDSLDDAGSSKL